MPGQDCVFLTMPTDADAANLRVRDLLDAGGTYWDEGLIQALFDSSRTHRIRSTPLSVKCRPDAKYLAPTRDEIGVLAQTTQATTCGNYSRPGKCVACHMESQDTAQAQALVVACLSRLCGNVQEIEVSPHQTRRYLSMV